MLHGTIFSATGAANRVLGWRCAKIDDMLGETKHVTRNNWSKIRDLALQVFSAGSKICNAKIAQKIVREPTLHGINFERVVVNRPV